MNTFEAIYERRATRNFEKGKEVPEETWGKIIDACRYALPSPTMDFPWRMLVVRDQDIKTMVANYAQEITKGAFGSSYELFRQHVWYQSDSTALRVAEYVTTGELWRYPEDAHVVVFPCLSRGDSGISHSVVLRWKEQTSPYLGFAAMNMWLVATALGIGAGYNAIPLSDGRRRDELQTVLGIPPSWEATGAFSFGIGSRTRLSGPSRGAFEALVFSEYWGNPWVRLAYRQGNYPPIPSPDKDLLAVVKNPRFVRNFRPGKIDEWMLEKVLTTAHWGPSPENFKQWRFIVIRERAGIDFIKHIVEEWKHAPWTYNSPEWLTSQLWYLKEEERLGKADDRREKLGEWYDNADTLVIPMTSTGWRDAEYTGRRGAWPHTAGHIATGCGIQNMILAATALDLGVHFDSNPIADVAAEELLREYFGIPSSWSPLGVMALGLPGEKMERPPVPPLEVVTFEETWGAPPRGKRYEL